MEKLTLNGTKGLELTREEVIDLGFKVEALVRKAQYREVNQDVLDLIHDASEKLDKADEIITDILEGNYEYKKIKKLFSDNNISYDFNIEKDGYIKITVENGDWKHDHLLLRHIMSDAGYVFCGRYVPDEETGEDVFSAIYLYH